MKHIKETPLKKKIKLYEVVQLVGILGFIFSIVNLFVEIFNNYILLYSVIVYLIGAFMGMELTYIEEKDTHHSNN